MCRVAVVHKLQLEQHTATHAQQLARHMSPISLRPNRLWCVALWQVAHLSPTHRHLTLHLWQVLHFWRLQVQLPPSATVTSLTSKGSHSDSGSSSGSGSGLGTCSAVASCALCSDFLTHFSTHTFYIQSINANVCVCVYTFGKQCASATWRLSLFD